MNKIEAIKLVRRYTGAGLAQAKDLVEHFERIGEIKFDTFGEAPRLTRTEELLASIDSRLESIWLRIEQNT